MLDKDSVTMGCARSGKEAQKKTSIVLLNTKTKRHDGQNSNTRESQIEHEGEQTMVN